MKTAGRFLLVVVLLLAARPAAAQYYSSTFGGEMGVGYSANIAGGGYTLTGTAASSQGFWGMTACEVSNVVAIVPLAPQTYQPAASASSSVTSPAFSTTAAAITLMGGTTNANGFTASGTIGGVSATTVSSTAGYNVSVEYVNFASAQSGITAQMGGGSSAMLAIPVSFLTSGTPSVQCWASDQTNSSFTTFQINVRPTGGSGHVMVVWARNAAGSQIPITFADNSSANGGWGNQYITLAPNIYYVSYSTGSDSNSSTTARTYSTPWQHLKGMTSGPSYTPAAGDIFVLRGCEDWPNASFPITWTYQGASAAHIIVSIDQSWYNSSTCTTAWNRPKFDAGNAVIDAPECSSASPNSNFNIFLYFPTGGSYYTDWNWIEETGYYWVQGEHSPCYGQSEVNKGLGGGQLTFTHFYMHNWHSPSALADVQFWTGNSATTVKWDHLVEDNSDGDELAGGNVDAPTTNSVIAHVANAFRISTAGVYANNNVSAIESGVGGEHSNAFESLVTNGSVYIYNFWMHDCANGGETMIVGNSGESDYLWNNVTYNCPNGGSPIAWPQTNGITDAGSLYIWNNTLVSTGACFGTDSAANEYATAVVIQNNFCPSSYGGTLSLFGGGTPNGAATITISNNPLESLTAANSQGYASTNTPPYSPTSRNCNGISSNCPIAAGVNLMTQATGLIASLGLDGTVGCTEQTVNTVVMSVCPQHTSVQRPGVGITPQAWDTGAYQLPPALTVNAGTTRGTIYQDIYGFLGGGVALNPTFAGTVQAGNVRWGGDPTSRYNFNLNVYCYVSYQTIWACGEPFGSTQTRSYSILQMISTYRAEYSGVNTLVTVPTIPFISQSTTTPQCSFPVSTYGAQQTEGTVNGQNCGNGVTTGSVNINDTNPTLNMVANTPSYEAGLISDVITNSGTGQWYQLDNEPGSWPVTHRDAVPCPLKWDVTISCTGLPTQPSMISLETPMSDEIYSLDSTAKQAIPSDYGPYGPVENCSSTGCPGGSGPSYAGQYILQQYKAHDTSVGHRTMYSYDAHFQIGSQTTVIPDDFNFNRNFDDPNYAGASVFPGYPFTSMNLINTYNSWISTYYPGTFLSFSELECTQTFNGGVDAAVVADALGRFGYDGVRMADMYPSGCNYPNGTEPIGFGYQIYRNYDGSGHQFGNTSVTASTTDQTTLSVYPATRSSDSHLTIVVVNKSPNALTSPLTLSGFTPNSSVPTYTYSNANLAQIVSGSTTASTIGSGYAYPGYSTTLFDLTPSGGGSTTISPTSQAFGSVTVGSSSANFTFTLTNGSASTVTGITVTNVGGNTGDFVNTGTGTCGSSLGAGLSCTIIYKFTPAAAGSRSTTLNVADSDPSSPQQSALTGTGVAASTTVAPAPQFAEVRP